MTRASVFLFLPQGALDYPLLRERAGLAESFGYDGLWLVDHMWARGMPEAAFLDGWTVLSSLAEATDKLRLGVLVSCNSYRNPGMLAKIATTADHISDGRIELGLGAGWMEEEYLAYGIEFPSIAARLEQLGESLEIIRRLTTQARTSFDGRHYRFCEAPFEPKPLQTPLPITLGGSGTRVMMRLVARYAQRWNCPMPAAPRLEEHLRALEEHCRNEGRSLNDIIISEQVAIVLGRNEAEVADKRALAESMIGGFVDLETMAICGTPPQVVAALKQKMQAGVRDFALLFGDLGLPDSIELFASAVLPKLSVG